MIKIKWILLIFALFFNLGLGISQYGNNSNIWYFGYGSGLDFNFEPPRVINDGKTFATEGTATYCDDNGDIVIYTDGINIWNKNHKIIPGATDLGGHGSSSQSATLVPKPGSDNLIYIFSVGTHLSPTFSYTTIDINLNGGLGGVVDKKQLLFDRCTESVVAVQHCNRKDFWILAHKENSDEFLVWELTSKGISSKPRIQKAGSFNTTANAYGLMKASFDGSKLAICGSRSHYLDLFNFDNATGTITEIFKARNEFTRSCYGVQFSPNDNLLYFSSTSSVSPTGSRIFQLDLRLGSKNNIFNAIKEIAYDRISWSLGSIQYAPNGKMYIGRNARPYLSEIAEPNKIGAACNFSEKAVLLPGEFAKFGLPNLIPTDPFEPDTIHVDQLLEIDTCLHQAVMTAIVDPIQKDIIYEWSKGNAVLSFTAHQITVDESGQYSVIVTVPRACQDSIYMLKFDVDIPDGLEDPTLIIINPSCQVLLGRIQVEISTGNSPFQYSLDDGSTYQNSNEFVDLDPGKYTLTIKDASDCIFVQEFEILARLDAPIIEKVDITPTVCNQTDGQVTVFINTNEMVMYSINGVDFQSSNIFVNLAAGKYTVTIKDQNGCIDIKEIEITNSSTRLFQNIEIMSTHCGENNGVMNIIADGNGLMYSINGSDFDDKNTFSDLAAGIYEIQIIDENGCLETRMALIVDSEGVFIDEIVQTSTLCNQANGAVRIIASGGTGIYTMEVNNTDFYSKLELNNLSKGEYTIEITDEIGCRADTVLVINQYDCPVYIPNSFSPNGDGINDVFRVFTHENFDGSVKSMRVYDRWGNRIFESNNLDGNTVDGWDGKFNGRALNTAVFVYLIKVENEGGKVEVYKGNLTLVK